MSCVFVTSDWHLGHANAYKFSGDFSSQEEREKAILDNYKQMVGNRDIVWFLGDIAFDLTTLTEVDQLPGEKRLILGNHDTDRFSKQLTLKDHLRVFSQIHSIHPYKHSWLTHAPIHPCELRGKYNVHGHVHQHSVDDPVYFNACLEPNEFKPIKYQDIMAELKERERNVN